MQRRASGVFKDIPFFRGVSEETLTRYRLNALSRALKAGEDLFAVGEPRRAVWFVRRGWLRVRVHSPGGVEATASILGPGEVVVCAASFGSETCQNTVTALTDAEVLGVPAPAFERWMRDDAAAACRLVGILDVRLRESSRLKAINAERAVVRLGLTLEWLAGKFGGSIPATRSLLADLTGLRAETCSRALSTLSRRRAVRAYPRRVEILRSDLLAAVPGRR